VIVRESPAKVNLYLKVLRKREDGYHDIASLMQRISLCDEMCFVQRDNGITLRCPGSSLPEDETNIVYRAVRSFFAALSNPAGVEITIRKKIPIAAGLGGGSSNAATALVTLNEMLGSPLGVDGLMRIGASVGADVPFFIYGKTAWAFGIGEELRPADPLPPLWYVLVNPGFEVSTRMVYENLKMGLTKVPIQYSMPRFHTLFDVIHGLYNELEDVSVRHYPVISELKNLLIAHGALGALMTGSGPTVFGIFEREEDAVKTEQELIRSGIGTVFRAHSL